MKCTMLHWDNCCSPDGIEKSTVITSITVEKPSGKISTGSGLRSFDPGVPRLHSKLAAEHGKYCVRGLCFLLKNMVIIIISTPESNVRWLVEKKTHVILFYNKKTSYFFIWIRYYQINSLTHFFFPLDKVVMNRISFLAWVLELQILGLCFACLKFLSICFIYPSLSSVIYKMWI